MRNANEKVRKLRRKKFGRGELLKQQIGMHFQAPENLFDPCRLLRVHQVALLLGIHEMTVWKWQRVGKMPKPIKVGDNTTAWRATDISEWLAAKVKEAQASE
jgi:prophage regulatory protein